MNVIVVFYYQYNYNLSIQSSENPVFTRRFACFVFQPYVFALVLPLRAETRANFYSPPTTLFSSLAEVCFASLVA